MKKKKRACCHRRNVDFGRGGGYTWIYIPVDECVASLSLSVFGTRTFLNILVALNTIPPAKRERERQIISRMQYTLWNCQMDGWMDGIHKKECVGVLIFTCCATVTDGLPRPAPSAFTVCPKKKERKKKKSEANPPTWHRCKDDDDDDCAALRTCVRQLLWTHLNPGNFAAGILGQCLCL